MAPVTTFVTTRQCGVMSSEGVTTQRLPEVRVVTGSGSITVIGEPRSDVVAEGRAELENDGESIVIVGPKRSRSLTVRCPKGTHIVVRPRSRSLTLRGQL